jgi:hypothetical protein
MSAIIQERIVTLCEWYAEIFPKEAPAPPSPPREPSPLADLDDRELLERMKRWTNGAKFERLHNGDSSDFRDDSADGVDLSGADLAYFNALAFATGGDRARMLRIARQSARWRPKFDEPRGSHGTYAEMTADEAIRGTTAYYTGTPAGGNDHHPEVQKQQFAISKEHDNCRCEELERENDELRAENQRLRAIFSGVHGIQERGGTPAEKQIALDVNFVVFADKKDEDGWVTITQAALATRNKTSEAAVGRVLHDKGFLCGPDGPIEKIVTRAPVLDENGDQTYDEKGKARWTSTMKLRPRTAALQMSLHETAIRLPAERKKRAPNRPKEPALDLTPFTGEQLLAALPTAEFTCPHCGTVDCAEVHVTAKCRVEACGGTIAEAGNCHVVQKQQFASSEPAPAPSATNVVDVIYGPQIDVSAAYVPTNGNGNGNGHKPPPTDAEIAEYRALLGGRSWGDMTPEERAASFKGRDGPTAPAQSSLFGLGGSP